MLGLELQSFDRSEDFFFFFSKRLSLLSLDHNESNKSGDSPFNHVVINLHPY